MEDTKTAYKFLRLIDGKIVSEYDKSKWAIGEWRNNPYPVVSECKGLNCCEFITDALGYVQGEIIAHVECRGAVVEGDDKITAQEMRIIKAWKWTALDSVNLAHCAALLVEDHFSKVVHDDNRIKLCNATIAKYISDPSSVTNEELSAARSAARSAAESAARSAAESAAWSAAESAAWSAAESAESAAWSAAESARLAAESARLAAESAAESAEYDMKVKIQAWIINYLEERKKIL